MVLAEVMSENKRPSRKLPPSPPAKSYRERADELMRLSDQETNPKEKARLLRNALALLILTRDPER